MKKKRLEPRRIRRVAAACLTVLCAVSAWGCGKEENKVGESGTESIAETELFSFAGEDAESISGNGAKIDYNEDNREIDALRLEWGEPMPYFKLSEPMARRFMDYTLIYTNGNEEYPYERSGNIGAKVDYAGFSDNEEDHYETRFEPLNCTKPTRIYIMVIVEEGSVEVKFREKDGEIKWESGMLTESNQFFLEFDELHMEQPILEINTKKTSDENVRMGVWRAFFGQA